MPINPNPSRKQSGATNIEKHNSKIRSDMRMDVFKELIENSIFWKESRQYFSMTTDTELEHNQPIKSKRR